MKIFKNIQRYLKIFNIKYLILLFVFCSLFPSAWLGTSFVEPVFAAEQCTLKQLQDLKKSTVYDPETKTEKTIEFEPSTILPLCVYFEGTTPELEQNCGCRNVNVLVSLLTKVATWLFSIVGAVALAVFIYGGFTILTAAGSAERVKKGKDALIAAVIGLVIVFTAQVGLKFLLKTILTPTEKETITTPEIAQPAKEGLNLEFVKPPLPKPQEEKK